MARAAADAGLGSACAARLCGVRRSGAQRTLRACRCARSCCVSRGLRRLSDRASPRRACVWLYVSSRAAGARDAYECPDLCPCMPPGSAGASSRTPCRRPPSCTPAPRARAPPTTRPAAVAPALTPPTRRVPTPAGPLLVCLAPQALTSACARRRLHGRLLQRVQRLQALLNQDNLLRTVGPPGPERPESGRCACAQQLQDCDAGLGRPGGQGASLHGSAPTGLRKRACALDPS